MWDRPSIGHEPCVVLHDHFPPWFYEITAPVQKEGVVEVVEVVEIFEVVEPW